MATYNTLTRGSTGADVKKLQQSLIDKGYDLGKTGADGKYGAITEAAVMQYQKDNKLTVDGMAGKQTQGSLYTVPKTTTNTTTKATTTPTATTTTNKQTATTKEPATQEATTTNGSASGKTLNNVSAAINNSITGGITHAVNNAKENQTYEADPIQPPAEPAPAAYDPATDAAYQSALATLLQVQQSAPVYKDSYSSQLQDAYDKIVNRDKFSYDVNADALYQQYKDQYIAQGKLAMADTMGQAAALNGGYGSSYAQSVGQQAYQGYMQQLNDVVPELYDRALAQYNQEGQNMLNQYAMLGDMADDEYAKYQDQLNKYYTDLDMARQDVDSAYNRGYGAYRDSVGDYQWQQQYAESVKQNEISNNQWQQSFDETVKQNEIGNSQWDQSFEYGKEQDTIHNNQTQQQIDEQIKQNAIGNQQWQDSFEYGKEQDAIVNNQNQQQINETIKQNEISNSQWQQSFDQNDQLVNYEQNQASKSEAYNRVMSFIGTDYKPTDKELATAGLTRAQYDALAKATMASSGSSPTTNVKAMSSTEIVDAIQGFSELRDNDGLETFLDDYVASGRITQEQADDYYSKYVYVPNTPENWKKTVGIHGN